MMVGPCVGMVKPLDIIVEEIVGMLGVGASDRALISLKLLGLSISMADEDTLAPSLLLCRRCRFDEADCCGWPGRVKDDAPGPGVDLGGAAAMGTTPLPPAAAEALMLLASEACVDVGLSLLLAWFAMFVDDCWPAVAMLNEEFFREVAVELAPFLPLVVPDALLPEPRFLFLITSVLRLRGRTTPCSFKNKPHALQSG